MYSSSKRLRFFPPQVMSSSSSAFINHVKNKIKICRQKFMSLQETMAHLLDNHQIHPHFTKSIWMQLQEENQEFVRQYYIRCEAARHLQILNDLFAQHVTFMLQQGLINPSTASPEIKKFLYESPEGIRIMQSLAQVMQSQPQIQSPESQVVNNPDNGNGALTSAQNQRHPSLKIRPRL